MSISLSLALSRIAGCFALTPPQLRKESPSCRSRSTAHITQVKRRTVADFTAASAPSGVTRARASSSISSRPKRTFVRDAPAGTTLGIPSSSRTPRERRRLMRSTCSLVVSPKHLFTGDAACDGGEEHVLVTRSPSPGTDSTPLLEKKIRTCSRRADRWQA
jgi:hypothetical protein